MSDVYSILRSEVDRFMTNWGESITLRSRTMSRDSQDDVSYSNSDTTITAFVTFTSIYEQIEPRGQVDAGTVFIYTKYDSSIEKGDLVQHQSSWYRIKAVKPFYTSGNMVYYECRANPMENYP